MPVKTLRDSVQDHLFDFLKAEHELPKENYNFDDVLVLIAAAYQRGWLDCAHNELGMIMSELEDIKKQDAG